MKANLKMIKNRVKGFNMNPMEVELKVLLNI